jgi:hypothetical protein
MLKLIFIAPKTSIARPIAILRTVLKDTQSLLKYRQAEAADALCEPGSAWQRIVEIDLRLAPITACRGQGRAVFRL